MRQAHLIALAAAICAGTYLAGFALLLGWLAPMGYGTGAVDAAEVIALIGQRPGLLVTFNTLIYLVNALALIVLVQGLSPRLSLRSPRLAGVAQALGLIWAGLLFGAGLIALAAIDRVLAMTDPVEAAREWALLHTVELGLGGGTEIVGGLWLATLSLTRVQPFWLRGFAFVSGLAGIATLIPGTGEAPGALFGLACLLWFIGTALTCWREPRPRLP